jgi:drug/metabolite transporter (DMT)-like permease
VTGSVWAAIAGLGFGLFQSANRVALLGMSVVGSTALQLAISAVILSGVFVVTEDLSTLLDAPPAAVAYFAMAGIVHFAFGWTFLNASQKRIGASRTGGLIATTPIFGVVVALVTLGEVPGPATIAGIAVIVAGAYVMGVGRTAAPRPTPAPVVAVEGGGSMPGDDHGGGIPLRAASFGLGTAVCWAISPVFTRLGLRELDSPLVGVTVSMVAATAVYAVGLLFRRRPEARGWTRSALGWKVAAGVLCGLATWARWYALSLTSVAAVLGLALLAVPTVLVVAPLLSGRHLERVTPTIGLGSVLIVAGALVVILE